MTDEQITQAHLFDALAGLLAIEASGLMNSETPGAWS
jgi:hypothetical protein